MAIKRIFEVSGIDTSVGRETQVVFRVQDADTNVIITNEDNSALLNIPKSMTLEIMEAVSLLMDK